MCSRTIVLAESNRHDEDLVMLGLEGIDSNVNITVLKDGQAVIDFFLPSHIGRASRVVSYRRTRGFELTPTPAHACDLLLLELALPKLDGLKVLKQLRWLFRADVSLLPPIVVVADSDDSDLVAEAYRCGASGYLFKFATVDRFVNAVQQTTRYWLHTMPRGDVSEPGWLVARRSVRPLAVR
jgi:CheY-like chemotaxis protein